MNDFDVKLNENGKIVNFLTDVELEPHPEEYVRQKFLKILHYEYQYPKNVLAAEVPVYYGSKELCDENGKPVRADIVVYYNSRAAKSKDQGQIAFVVECKAPDEDSGYNQLVSYIFNTSASGGVWFNDSGDESQIKYFRRITEPNNKLVPWTGIPRYKESWDPIERRTKSELISPKDIKGLLRRCHNKLHGRGVESEEEDLTMDMVRIILAKAQDEEKPGELPEFYCTPEEYNTEKGRKEVANRVQNLFEEVKGLNSEVFSDYERITVGERAICDVVIELQNYRVLSDLTDSQDWDLMGHAYEEYTATYLKRKKGQYFTNRLIVDFLASALDPSYTDIILDPAGGSGGFLTGSLRHVRKKVLSTPGSKIAQDRQLRKFTTRLFMVESSRRLVKVAKTAMILNGDGHAGMTQGDSLGDYHAFNETILAQCSKNTPTVILTNPPFAGTEEGRVTDEETLHRFKLGKKWSFENMEAIPTEDIIKEGVPPEMLFFERCIDWLAPNGKLGIVMPKSFLDTKTYLSARNLLFKNCQLCGIIVCHKNTFQPHTGVRTCLIILRKYNVNEEPIPDYSFFCAISRKIGQDSEGVPIYRLDASDQETEELDHDLDEILKKYRDFLEDELKFSEYCFSIKKSDINDKLNINPQAYLPKLNNTLKEISAIDEAEGWSILTIGEIHHDIKVFKGPRLKSENLIVEEPVNNTTEPYYTPSAILQEKSDSLKYMDLSKASESQLKTIAAIRVYRGDIVVSRSGTIGRVSYITKMHDGAILSDDMIRIRIPDEKIRLYVYHFLQTRYAQDQMKMNEYGAVQQHLEPEHLRDLLVPIPEDWSIVDKLVKNMKKLIETKEAYYDLNTEIGNDICSKLNDLISVNSVSSEI